VGEKVMLLPYQVDVAVMRRPYANWGLIGFTCLVSAIWLQWPTDALLLSSDDFKVYQLVTHAFIHMGLLHLLGNTLFLYLFGNAVNAKLGHLPYLGLYLALACVSGLAWYLGSWQNQYCLGASGAVMGVAGVFFLYYPFNEVSVFYWIWIRVGTFYVAAFWLLILYVALDVIGLLDASSGVAHIAHVAGFGSGAAVATVLILRGIVRPEQNERSLLEALGMTVPRVERPRPREDYAPLVSRSILPFLPIPPPERPPLRPPGTFPPKSTDRPKPPAPPAPRP
jgi:membrane associated rhomboid family serine protease